MTIHLLHAIRVSLFTRVLRTREFGTVSWRCPDNQNNPIGQLDRELLQLFLGLGTKHRLEVLYQRVVFHRT